MSSGASLGGGANFGGATQARPEQSEVQSALSRLDDSLRSLTAAREDLYMRLDAALRPAIPRAADGSKMNAIPPSRSSIGSHIHNVADAINSEADDIRDLLSRLAI
jgi:hypothetical protein